MILAATFVAVIAFAPGRAQAAIEPPWCGDPIPDGTAALVAHGTNTVGTSRMTLFAMNPLYRADPEREWPAVSSAAYWADQ